MGEKESQVHLNLAKKQLEKVQVASWDPQDAEDAVTWAFYAYENGIVAVAEKLGLDWQKTHVSKVKIANELHEQDILSVDIGPVIENLNELRKDVQYGEPGPELQEVDLEDLATQLEEFVDEVESVINKHS